MFQRKKMKNMCLITAASLFVLSLVIFIVVRYDVFINQQLKKHFISATVALAVPFASISAFTTAYTVTSIVAVAGTVTVRVSDTATVTVTINCHCH